MKIIREFVALAELKQMASATFGEMVKAVVDAERKLIAVDAELHADLEALLLQEGSRQKDLWGINFYPDLAGDDFVEFDSMINLRPSQGNKSRGVDDADTRGKIFEIVRGMVRR